MICNREPSTHFMIYYNIMLMKKQWLIANFTAAVLIAFIYALLF